MSLHHKDKCDCKHHTHEECGCGHHHHEHEECGCGHHHHEPCSEKANLSEQIYILENLDCANCAAKMEKKINELQEVERATITFATKQLKIIAQTPDKLLKKIQEVCASIESEVVVKKAEEHVQKDEKIEKKELWGIGISVVLFIAGIGIKSATILLVIAYLILGSNILWRAVRNLFKGHVFDENFLMSIATIAAFAIGDYAEAVGVMLFFRIGELFEEIAVKKSRKEIMKTVDLRPDTVQLVKDCDVHEIVAKDAKPGDILLVRVGDRIPLDAIVVEGESRIDTSAVTGEAVPIKVTAGDNVISGCVNTSGVLKIRVENTLEDSMVTRILNSVENAAAGKPKVDRFITRFARVYTPVVVATAILTAIIPSLITGEWTKWIYTAITFLVISCPCALVLSVPLAFFSGIGRGSKERILFKSGLAMETLQNVRAIVWDKTGTITKGVFEVQQCVALEDFEEERVLALSAMCELQSNHPIAHSIVKEARNRNVRLAQPEEVKEIAGKGVCATIGGMEILCGNQALFEQFGVTKMEMQKKNYGTEVLVACNGKQIGYIVISDQLKDDAKEAVAWLKTRGIHNVMLTGDTEESAQTIATEVGMQEIYAKLMPDEKVKYLHEVREKYGKTMFVGDGINDAPVLAGADVSAAMGNGADAAIEASDVVFMTSSLKAVVQAIRIAKETNRIAKQNIVFALGMKVLVMLLGFFGLANMWMAVFADTGVAMLCVLNSIRILRRK